MIALTLRAAIDGLEHDLVLRATATPRGAEDAQLDQGPSGATVTHDKASIEIPGVTAAELEGDVLLVQPRQGAIQRLIRANSVHNTFLVTERCDQLCVMCSQPPKKTHVDLFRHFTTATMLAPQDAVLGISGGEPTLYKTELFRMLELALTLRPDLRFHVLTNAQHFVEEDVAFLSSEAARRVQWGVPLYSHKPDVHDRLVGKVGAWERLRDGLAILCRSGAHVELRTVVMRENASHLPELARFIETHLPFVNPWAIMQLENIGFARNRWSELFHDHSLDFTPVARALDRMRLRGIPAFLYNFPLCTVPTPYRRFAPSTISDWKRRYEARCDGCIARRQCGGFFEWHPDHASYEHLGIR